MRNSGSRFATRFCRCSNIRLLFERFQRPIEEVRRHNDRATPNAPRSDLDRLALRNSDVLALLSPELRKGNRGHVTMLQLVQVVRHYLRHPERIEAKVCLTPQVSHHLTGGVFLHVMRLRAPPDR